MEHPDPANEEDTSAKGKGSLGSLYCGLVFIEGL